MLLLWRISTSISQLSARTFSKGLPKLSDEVFDERQPSLIVVDDHMSHINQLVADIFTKISHHRNISVLHLTQNLFDKHKFARTISLNLLSLSRVVQKPEGSAVSNICKTAESRHLEVYCGSV